MKKFLLILLAALLAFPMTAVAGVDLTAMTAANAVLALVDAYGSYCQSVAIYSHEDGSEWNPYDFYVWQEDDGTVQIAFQYMNGDWDFYGDGGGYGYSAFLKKPYLLVFLRDAYETYMYDLLRQNACEFADVQHIISEKTTTDGLLNLIVEGFAPDFYAGFFGVDAPQTYRFYYTADSETLVLKTSDVYILGDEGGETRILHTEVLPGVHPKAPNFKAEISAATEWREVHVILDPGTEDESDEVIYVPIDMPLGFHLPDGYALYNDVACATPYAGESPDENGRYPKILIVYAALSGE